MRTSIIFLIILSAAQIFYGQSFPVPGDTEVRRTPDEATRRDIEKRESDLRNLKIPGQTSSLPNGSAIPESYSEMFIVPARYYDEYASFLKSKKSGLIRIFADTGCYQGKTVTVAELERCAEAVPIQGGGSFYSFRLGSHSSNRQDWWDIHFADNKILAGNATVQAVISEIGNVNFRDITLKSKAFGFLSEYKPKTTLSDIKEENKILEKGLNSNGFTYSNAVSAKLNSTYIARIIAYSIKGEPEISQFPWGALTKNIDIKLAFKVVGIEQDGSLILLYKELKREFPRKKLTRD